MKRFSNNERSTKKVKKHNLQQPTINKFVLAAGKGDLEEVKTLASQINDINSYYRNEFGDPEDKYHGRAAIHQAARNGHMEVFKYLLAENADINLNSKVGCYTALHLAARNGQLEMVTHLVEQHNMSVDSSTQNNVTSLHLAVTFGYINVVEYLLAHGANPAIENHRGQNVLQIASYNGDYDIVKCILSHPDTEVNAVSEKENRSALYLAALKGFSKIVQLLIEYEADLNTHLKIAYNKADNKVVKILLENGASLIFGDHYLKFILPGEPLDKYNKVFDYYTCAKIADKIYDKKEPDDMDRHRISKIDSDLFIERFKYNLKHDTSQNFSDYEAFINEHYNFLPKKLFTQLIDLCKQENPIDLENIQEITVSQHCTDDVDIDVAGLIDTNGPTVNNEL